MKVETKLNKMIDKQGNDAEVKGIKLTDLRDLMLEFRGLEASIGKFMKAVKRIID